MTEPQEQDALFGQLARIGKAISSPKRIELLEVLGQGERSVESLAAATSMSVGNTSAHLQVLRSARLVETRREGTKVMYSVPTEQITDFVRVLWQLADSRLTEIESIIRRYLRTGADVEHVTHQDLAVRSLRRDVYIIDVRPREEYEAGHIPGSVSVPFDELTEHLASLPTDVDIVVYCRGRYSLSAPKAAQVLQARGLRAMVLKDGLPEWRRGGLPVVSEHEERGSSCPLHTMRELDAKPVDVGADEGEDADAHAGSDGHGAD